MRGILAAHAGQQDARDRLRGATESTTSGKSLLWWTSGAPAPDFPIGTPAASNSGRFPFLARPSRGGALGHGGTSPALAMSDALRVTPRVTTCTGPLGEDWPPERRPRRCCHPVDGLVLGDEQRQGEDRGERRHARDR